jgi:hypothetical protein
VQNVLTVLAVVAAVVAAAVIGMLIWRRRRAAQAAPPTTEPLVRVDQLDQQGPLNLSPRLYVHHLPMRLSALVLAPLGRESDLPPDTQLGPLVDNLVPGFRRIVDAHHPEFARWPAQLSARGFVRSFFRQVALPGNRGSGTPWCSLAGRFDADGKGYLIGIVCRGEASNSLGELEVASSSKWLDILRVRDDGQ